jgi:flagellar hook-length control protein FliK
MEMTNLTAGGPSYGLLDMLFGKKPQEEAADGKEFDPLLNLIKGLKQKADEDAKDGWTVKETEAGKKGEDYPALGLPAMFASSQNVDLAKVAQTQEGLMQLSPAQLKQLMQAKIKSMQQQGPAPRVVEKPEPIVSEALQKLMRESPESMEGLLTNKQPILAKLSPAEMQEASKAIDSRIKELAKQILAKDSQPPVEGLKEHALAAAAGMEALQTDAAKKQLNLKGAEVVQATEEPKLKQLTMPEKKLVHEKMFTTEDYLQVKDQGPKELEGKKAEPVMAKQEMQSDVQGNMPQKHIQKAASGSEQSEQLVTGKPDVSSVVQKSQPLKSKVPDLKKGDDIHQNLPADLALKTSAGVAVREVFIADVKPEQMRVRLASEVADSISVQAKNGGGEMKLVIHPDNLGELKLKVGTKDGKVQVTVTADNNEVAQSLRSSQHDLKEALSGQHLTLSKFEVNVASDSSMANQDNSGNNHNHNQSQLFQDSGDRSNNGSFADQYARENASSYREENFRLGDAMMPKAKAAAYKPSNNGNSRLDVVA